MMSGNFVSFWQAQPDLSEQKEEINKSIVMKQENIPRMIHSLFLLIYILSDIQQTSSLNFLFPTLTYCWFVGLR